MHPIAARLWSSYAVGHLYTGLPGLLLGCSPIQVSWYARRQWSLRDIRQPGLRAHALASRALIVVCSSEGLCTIAVPQSSQLHMGWTELELSATNLLRVWKQGDPEAHESAKGHLVH